MKAHLARAGRDLNIFMALSLIRRICEEGLNEKNQRAGWARCGFVPGELLQRNVVLKERFEELFSSKKAGSGMDEKPSTKTSAALSLLETVSPKKLACSSSTCSAKVSPADRFCSACGAENSNFDKEIAELNKSGKRSGWYKPPEQPAIVPENPEEERMERGMGDLLARLRRQKNPEPDAKPKEEPSEPAAAAASASTVPAETLAEFDLDNPSHAVEWILSAFSPQRRSELKPLAEFYVSQLKSVSKSLTVAFQKEVIGPRLLSTANGRDKWVAATKANRSKRFVPPPSELWKKPNA